VKARADEKCCTANARRPPASLYPISAHTLYKPKSSVCHHLGLLLKLELTAETRDVERRIDDGQLEIEPLTKAEICVAQHIDIGL
jgi:hypothetical protein